MRIRSKYYHHFYAYAFDHFTAIPVIMKNGYVYLKDTNIDLLAWGDGDETTKSRKARAIQLGIQTEQQRYSQPRVTRWFSQPGREFHPLRIFFGI